MSCCWEFFCALVGGIRRKSLTATLIMLVSGSAILPAVVNSLRTMIGNPGGSLFLRFVEQRAPAIGLGIAITLIGALVFGGIRVLRPVYRLLLVVSSFLLFTFGQSLYRIATFNDQLTRNGPTRFSGPDFVEKLVHFGDDMETIENMQGAWTHGDFDTFVIGTETALLVNRSPEMMAAV